MRVQGLCESRGDRPGLSVLTSLLVSVDVKNYRTMLRHWSQLVPNMSTDSSSEEKMRVQELSESRGSRPGLPVLMSPTVSMDVKQQFVPT